MNRRSLLTGLIAAPAVILTPGLLMPVRALPILTNQFLYQVNFYKNGLWVGGTNPKEGYVGFNLPKKHQFFSAGDIMTIEYNSSEWVG